MTPWTLSQNAFILRRPKVANFADIIKISTMFNKKTFKDSKKIKKLEVMSSNAIYIYISWYSKICWSSVRNADDSRTQVVYQVIYIVFVSSLGKA